MRFPFLTGAWEKIILINYAIDPAVLLPYVPPETELDMHEGVCYVSVVGFLFTHVKAGGIFPVPGYNAFPEINLRFYVRHYENGVWQRGIVFVREIVSKKRLAWTANVLFGEKYRVMPARHSHSLTHDKQQITYAWKFHKKWSYISVSAGLVPYPIQPGSAEEFLTENHWGYTKRTDKITSCFETQHPQWKLYAVEKSGYQLNRIKELFGAEFVPYLHASPRSVLLAEGSAIEMKHIRILKHKK